MKKGLIILLIFVIFFNVKGQGSGPAEPVCRAFVEGRIGAKCDPEIHPDIADKMVVCHPFSACSPRTGLCAPQSALGARCTTDADCVSALADLQCIGGRCLYKKPTGQACRTNEECYSGRCMGGRCVGMGHLGQCDAQGDIDTCAFHPTIQTVCGANNTCIRLSDLGEPCSVDPSNYLPCKVPYVCVRSSDITARGTCMRLAKDREPCSPLGVEQPPCDDDLFCYYWVDNRCHPTAWRNPGETCAIGDNCIGDYACNTTFTELGICKPSAQIPCTEIDKFMVCKTPANRGICKCTSPSQPGYCSLDGPDKICPNEARAFEKCVIDNCNYAGRGTGYAFDAESCHSQRCRTEFLRFICCASRTTGFVNLPEFNPNLCQTV